MQTAVYPELSRIVTNYNRYMHANPILKRLHWLPMNFTASSKRPLLTFFYCLQVSSQWSSRSLVLTCVFNLKDMAQDITVQIRSKWRFHNTTHLYIKKILGHSFAFGAATVCNDLPDDVGSAPAFAYFRKKL